MKDDNQSVVLTGRTFVTGALADIFPSMELVERGRSQPIQAGDMKLWCHLQHGQRAPVWSGQFRAAVFDGKRWRTFRLNIVADSDARYNSFDERPVKARRCFDAIAHLKGQVARRLPDTKGSKWLSAKRRTSTTWGCTFTMKAGSATPSSPASAADSGANARATVGDTALANVSTPALQPAPVPLAAARSAQPPATLAAAATATPTGASTSRSTGRRGRRNRVAEGQLTLF